MASETAIPTRENLLLSESRSEYLSQESLNRELSVKAGAMSALAIAMFGASATIDAQSGWTAGLLMIVLLSVLATIAMAAFIVKPSEWRRPHSLPDVKALAEKNDAGNCVIGIADAYIRAVGLNEKILKSKARLLKYMARVSFMSFLFLAFALFLELAAAMAV